MASAFRPSRATVPALPSRIAAEDQIVAEIVPSPGAPSEFEYTAKPDAVGRSPRVGDRILGRMRSGELTLDFLGVITGTATQPLVDLGDGEKPVPLNTVEVVGIAIGRFIPYQI